MILIAALPNMGLTWILVGKLVNFPQEKEEREENVEE